MEAGILIKDLLNWKSPNIVGSLSRGTVKFAVLIKREICEEES